MVLKLLRSGGRMVFLEPCLEPGDFPITRGNCIKETVV